MLTFRKILMPAFAMLAVVNTAACANMPAPSSSMALGARVAAPDAYIDYCRREPGDCGVSADAMDVEIAEAHAITKVSSQENWRMMFAKAKVNAPTSTIASPTPTTAVEPAAYDWGAAFGRAPTAMVADAATPKSELDAEPRVIMTPQVWAQISKINSQTNRAIIQRSDASAYGRADVWLRPLAEGKRYGDCEDYVLEKLATLTHAGLDQRALSIAVVETLWGETHAVLVVHSNKGDYVLDNLSPWILPWDKTSYRWRARQMAGDAFVWRMVASSQAPALIASR